MKQPPHRPQENGTGQNQESSRLKLSLLKLATYVTAAIAAVMAGQELIKKVGHKETQPTPLTQPGKTPEELSIANVKIAKGKLESLGIATVKFFDREKRKDRPEVGSPAKDPIIMVVQDSQGDRGSSEEHLYRQWQSARAYHILQNQNVTSEVWFEGVSITETLQNHHSSSFSTNAVPFDSAKAKIWLQNFSEYKKMLLENGGQNHRMIARSSDPHMHCRGLDTEQEITALHDYHKARALLDQVVIARRKNGVVPKISKSSPEKASIAWGDQVFDLQTLVGATQAFENFSRIQSMKVAGFAKMPGVHLLYLDAHHVDAMKASIPASGRPLVIIFPSSTYGTQDDRRGTEARNAARKAQDQTYAEVIEQLLIWKDLADKAPITILDRTFPK